MFIKKFRKIKKVNLYVALGLVVVLFLIGIWLSSFNKNKIDVEGDRNESLIRGESCNNYNVRPIALMIASDPVARPLSGISYIDMAFEMPVTPGGVTRIMAVFQCEEPSKIGSIRSAREDFLPLAASINAVYGHWGGESDALKKLKSGVLDNIDALTNKFNTYYRDNNKPAPHNGFTSYNRIMSSITSFSYSDSNTFTGYPRVDKEDKRNISQLIDKVNINYDFPYNVEWQYVKETNSYLRFRGGSPEIDTLDNSQVEVKNILILETNSSPLRDQYINVDVVGTGQGRVYKNGLVQNINWQKDDFSSKIFLYDSEGKEIKLVPGPIWFHYVIK